jgi:hypothetical protein
VATPERRLLLIALAARLIPAALIYGTDDVTAWETWGRMLAGGGNPYASKYLIAWPPLWLPVVWISYLTADATGLPFYFIAKLFPIAADLVLMFLLYSKDGYRTALAYAVNPVSIYTSSIHGNFDPIPTLCLTAAVLSARGAGVWLGVGAAFKTWPLLMLPAVIAPLKTMRMRMRVALTAIGIFVGALLLAFPFGSGAVTEVLKYRGGIHWWGISSISFLFGGRLPASLFLWTFYGAMAAVALLLAIKRTPAPHGALLMLLTLFVTAPAFGLQYLIWIVPIALLIDRRRATIYTVLATALIAWELLVRPYTGHIGEMVRVLPHPGYARAYGHHTDQLYTVIGRLLLWAYCCWWWLAAARALPAGSAASGRSSSDASGSSAPPSAA